MTDRRLSPDDISALESPADPQVSPDGRRVAWTAAPHGYVGQHRERGVWVASLDESGSARRWTWGADDHSPRWSPDGRRLAFLSDRSERGTAGLHVMDLEGGEGRPLVTRKRAVEAFAWSPEGTRLAFLAADEPTDEDDRREEERDDADVWGERWRLQRLWTVTVEGTAPQRVWAPPLHVSAVSWSPDGSRLALLARRSPLLEHSASTQLWTCTPDGDARLVCAAPWAGRVDWAGPGTVVFDGSHDDLPQGSRTAWAVDPDGGTPRVVGTGADEPRCTADAAATPDGRLLLVVVEGLATRLEWADPAGGGREVALDVPGDVYGVSIGPGGRGPVLAYVLLGTSITGQVVAGPLDRLRVVSDHGRELSDVPLAQPEPLLATAADETPLDGVLLRPVGGGPGPWPTVVHPHGGPYGRSGLQAHVHPLDWAQLLAQHGYAVLLPNYRGGAGHGHAFAAAARGTMGGVEWDDVLRLLDAAVEAGVADPERLGIGGWSQGGFLTGWAVTATDRFRAAVMGAGVSDWAMLAMTGDLPGFEAVLAGDRAAEGSPMTYAGRRTTPLLILHGEVDERVPVSQATAFHRVLEGQQAPVELVVYPREPHGIGERRHQVDLQRRVLAWFDRHLLGTARP